MSFAPVVPVSGIAGWRFLERTEAAQQAAFGKSPEIARETAYFREHIGEIDSAEALIADRTLFKVALGAFGLEDEIDKKAFIRKVLEEGTERTDAFAIRLTDRRYRSLAAAFGFGNAGGARTADAGFADQVTALYKQRSFEATVGETDETMRLSLNYRRAVAEVTASPSDKAVWYTILGDKPVREVVEAALGLPSAIAKVDIDKQVDFFAQAASRVLKIGDPHRLTEPDMVEEVIRRYLARTQIENGPSAGTPGYGALSLLQSAAAPGLALPGAATSGGLMNLLLARG
jgi:Protein of unknown function (DUF1217)